MAVARICRRHGSKRVEPVAASMQKPELVTVRAFCWRRTACFRFPLGRGDSRTLGLALEPNFDRSSHCSGCFDQCVELNRQVARVQHAVQLGAAGGHALCHVHFAELAALHRVFQLLGQCACERTSLNFFINAVLFEEVIKTAARVGIDFSCFGY